MGLQIVGRDYARAHRRFIVSSLTCMYLIHFELVFVHGVKESSDFIFLHVAVQHRLLK